MFQIISTHENEFGCNANWNYFEAGHGKGWCDGIGGTVKRLADDAVTQNEVVIQDPLEFFVWSQETQNEIKIRYLFVSSEETKVCKKLLQERADTLKPVVGTMKVHAVNGLEENKMAVRNISFFCYSCLTAMQFEEKSCFDGWSTHNLQKRKGNKITSTNHDVVQPKEIDYVKHAKEPNEDVAEQVQKHFHLEVCHFVAAIYEEDLKPYIGKIVEIDDSDVHVIFMKTSTSTSNLHSTFK